MRTRVVALATASVFLTAAGTAQAVHWPYFGGDAGRSGLQPVDQGATPVAGGYQLTDSAFTGIRTPVVTSAGGGPAVQRLAFGTSAGLVHLRLLATGAAVGPAAGRDIVEGTTSIPFGGSPSSVGFADTSTATALGQLFVVHNDPGAASADPDLEIAQIDEATGDLIGQKDIAGTADLVIGSSAVATGPDAAGGRSLFFTAGTGSAARLFKLPIAKAGARDAVIGEPQQVAVRATADASPTFASLAGVPHVLVGTADGNVRSFKVADLAPGPATARPLRAAPLGGSVLARTPSVPVSPDGMPPATAPSLTVAVESITVTEESTTQVFRLQVQGQELVPEAGAQSDVLAGAPAAAVALGQRVVVTTSLNLHSLDPTTLKDTKTLSPTRLVSGTGFAANSALVSGNFIYVVRDNGEQLVLRLADAQPVPAGEFRSNGSSPTNESRGFGQPSLSRGFVQYGTSQGLFVYRNRDLVAPAAALGELTGGPFTATASDARGIASVTFRVNGNPVGTKTTPDSGSPFNAMAPAAFSVPRPALASGTYTVDAVASDGTLTTVTPGRQLVIPKASTAPTPPAGSTARRKARKITAKLTPSRDRRAPYRFTVTGRITPPTGVACGGRISVQTKAGRKTLSTRRATVRSNCTYRIRLSFKNRKRFGRRAKLTVRVRYLGSARISPQTVRTLSARVR